MAGKKKTKEQIRLELHVCKGELEALHDELDASQEIRARLVAELSVLKAESCEWQHDCLWKRIGEERGEDEDVHN